MGGEYQATFLHSTVGIPIILEDLHYVARVGMKTGTGVEVQPNAMSVFASTRFTPDLVKMMKVISSQEFVALAGDKSAPNNFFKCITIITPALSLHKLFDETNMPYATIFMEIVKQIN